MPCKEYERLEGERKSEMSQYAQITYAENLHLRGTSDKKSKQVAKEAMARASAKSKEIEWHRASCEECKRNVAPPIDPHV
jgi:flavin-binding protein dodecin